jgi:hypothetical protein
VVEIGASTHSAHESEGRHGLRAHVDPTERGYRLGLSGANVEIGAAPGLRLTRLDVRRPRSKTYFGSTRLARMQRPRPQGETVSTVATLHAIVRAPARSFRQKSRIVGASRGR